jgi:hypothetical protein
MAMPDGSSGPKWTALFEKVVAELGESDHATAGKMFGMPCGNIGGKAFAGLYQDDMPNKHSARWEDIGGQALAYVAAKTK